MNQVKVFFSKEYVVLSCYVLLCIIISVQHYLQGPGEYNNYVIFRQSFSHLMAGVNPYVEYPAEYLDLFLYHPSFSVLFSPYASLPDWAGLPLWLLTCGLLWFYAIRLMPLTYQQKLFCWWFVLLELSTSIHNQQTNPIIAACGLFTFIYLEKNRITLAALFPILAFCIKGYGLIFAGLFIFYPQPFRYILSSLGWLVLLCLLPLPLVGWDRFLEVYQQWFMCMQEDYKVNYGFSIMGLLKVYWPSFEAVALVQLIGLGCLGVTWLLYVVRSIQERLPFSTRLALLAYLCLWVIVFNHAAESPTYIIAVQGVALYYLVLKPQQPDLARIVAWAVFLFTVLAPTDIYPLVWRQQFFRPYLIKVIPCVLVYFIFQVQLIIRWFYHVKSAKNQYSHSLL